MEEEIKRLAEEGKTQFMGDIERIVPTEPNWTVIRAVSYNHFGVHWETTSAGFGECGFYFNDGKIHCDSEGLGRDFVRAVLNKLVDDAIFD